MIIFKTLLLIVSTDVQISVFCHLINNDHYFPFDEIPLSTVLSHLTSLDVTKSTGPDGLSAKEIFSETAVPLTGIFKAQVLFHLIGKISHNTYAERTRR